MTNVSKFDPDNGLPIMYIDNGDGTYSLQVVLGAGALVIGTVNAVGNIASGAADSGNPVKIAGVFNTTPATFTNGQRGDIQIDARGAIKAALTVGGANALIGGGVPADAVSNSFYNLLMSNSYGQLFNGTTWDRQRNNNEGTALASAARTASVNSSDITNYNSRGVTCFINVTAITASPSVVFKIQGKDPISGNYVDLVTSAAIVGTGITALKVFPGIAAVANVAASDILPRTWRVIATHGNADSITYSVGYSLSL